MERFVLIVNDHEWSARSLESVLQAGGFHVERVFSAEAAKRSVGLRIPDALLVDIQLPDQSGPALCAELRATGAIPPMTPIIVTTAGEGGRAARLAALKAGAWDFIGLPADADTLLLKLSNMVAVRVLGS